MGEERRLSLRIPPTFLRLPLQVVLMSSFLAAYKVGRLSLRIPPTFLLLPYCCLSLLPYHSCLLAFSLLPSYYCRTKKATAL